MANEQRESAASDSDATNWLNELRQGLSADHPARILSEATEQVIGPLGLGDTLELTAALAPLLRAQSISLRQIQRHAGVEIGAMAAGLDQLFELSLPGQWTPGEQLPVAQGEALRRMLLAVVNDFRLVIDRLVRAAE